MENDDVISEYVDKNGVKGDTDFILEHINKVYDAIKKVSSLEVTLKGITGSKELEQITKQLAAANKVLSESTKQLTNITKTQAEAELILAKARTENAKAQKIETQ